MSRETLTAVVVAVSQTLWLRALKGRFVPVLLRPLLLPSLRPRRRARAVVRFLTKAVAHQLGGTPTQLEMHVLVTATVSTGPSPPFSSTLSAPIQLRNRGVRG